MTPPLWIVSVRPLMATMPRDQGVQIQTIVVDDVEEDCIDDCIDVDVASVVVVAAAFVVDVLASSSRATIRATWIMTS